MINFTREKKHLEIFKDENSKPFLCLELISGTVTNKYEIITNFVSKASEFYGSKFDDWFENDYLGKNYEERLEENVSKIKTYCDGYLNSLNIDFSNFVDASKQKNGSILFTVKEVTDISRFSCYSKLFSFISNSNLRPNRFLFKKLFKNLAKEVLDPDIIDKIFSLVQTKTYTYSLTDRYMWNYLEVFQCRTIDMHVIEIFNFILNSIITLAEPSRNPIVYFISVINESIKWFLRSAYRQAIVYDDSISAQDVHSYGSNLRSYTCNDTLYVLKEVSYQQLYRRLEDENSSKFEDTEFDPVVPFQEKLEELKLVSPISQYVAYPLLAQLTGVPYKYFSTIKPDDSFAIGVFLQDFLFTIDFPYKEVSQLLECIPLKTPCMTTYKVRDIQDYLNRDDFKFYSFKTRVLPYNLISVMIGKIRVHQTSLFTNKKVNVSETSLVDFFCDYFSKKIEFSEQERTQFKKVLMNKF